MPIKARQVPVDKAAFFAKGLFLAEGKPIEISRANLVEKVVHPWPDKLKIDSATRDESRSSSSRSSSSTSDSRSTISSECEGELLLEEHQYSQSCSTTNRVVGVPPSEKADNSSGTKNSERSSPQKERESVDEEEESDEEALVAARKRTAAFLYPKSERQRQRRQQQERRAPQPFSSFNPQPSKPSEEETKKKDYLAIHHTSHTSISTEVIRNDGNILEHSKTSPLSVRPENSRTQQSSSVLLSDEEKGTQQILLNTHAIDPMMKEWSAEITPQREEKALRSSGFTAPAAAAGTALATDSSSTLSHSPTEVPQPPLFPSTSPTSLEGKGGTSEAIPSSSLSSSFLRHKDVNDGGITDKAVASSKPLNLQCEDALQELSAAWCIDGHESTEKPRNQACDDGANRNLLHDEEGSVIPPSTPPLSADMVHKGRTSRNETIDAENSRVFVASAELRKAFSMAASRVSTQRSYSAQSVKRFPTHSEQRPSSSVLANSASLGVSSSPHTTSSRTSPGNVLCHAFGGLPMSMEDVAALQVTERNDKRLHADNLHQGVGGPRASEDGEKGKVWSSSAWFRTPEALVEEATARLDRFLESARWLEKLVRDFHFQTSVAHFFYRHHKLFLSHAQRSSLCDSQTDEQAALSLDGGEDKTSKNGVESYSHEEYAVFSEFSQHIAKAVYQWLSSHVPDFDEEEFAEDFFNTSVGAQNDGLSTITPMNETEPPMNVASYPVWRIILSISSFTCFVVWMVDFIEEEFQLNEQEEGMGMVVAGTRGLKALLASTYRAKKKGQTDLRMPLQEMAAEMKAEGQKSETTVPPVAATTTHGVRPSSTGDLFHEVEEEDEDAAFENAIMGFPPSKEHQEAGRIALDVAAALERCTVEEEEEEVVSPSPSKMARRGKAVVLRKKKEWEERGEEVRKKGRGKGAGRTRSSGKGNPSTDQRSATALISSSIGAQRMTSMDLRKPTEGSFISSACEDNSMPEAKREKDEGGKHNSRPSQLLGSSGVACVSSLSPSFGSFPGRKFPPPAASSKVLPSPASSSAIGDSFLKKSTAKEKQKVSTAMDAPQEDDKKAPPRQVKQKRQGTKDSHRSLSCEAPASPPPSSLRLSYSSTGGGGGGVNGGSICSSDVVGIRGRQSRHLPPLLASPATTSFCTPIPSPSLTTTAVAGSSSAHPTLSSTSSPSSTLWSGVRATDPSAPAGAAPCSLEESQKRGATAKHSVSTLQGKWRTEEPKGASPGMQRTSSEENMHRFDALPSRPSLLPSRSHEEEKRENKKGKSVKRKQPKTTDTKVLGQNMGNRVPSPLPPPPTFYPV